MFRFEGGKDHSEDKVTLPVYLNATCSQLLFTLDFVPAEGSAHDHSFYERGVALISSDLS
jgi:hypothetical protein